MVDTYRTRGNSALRRVGVMGSLIGSLCLGILLVLLASSNVYGQASEGSILGTVTDNSGAAIANATVTVTSLETGVSREMASDAAGDYVVTNIPLGTYRVVVVATGFQKGSQESITVEIKARVRVDFTLQISGRAEKVIVNAGTAQLQTDTPEVGGTITQNDLQEIPVYNRNFLTLAELVPGTTGGVSTNMQNTLNGVAVTANGAAAELNEFIIDGVAANMEFSGAMSTVPPMDSIQEFKVQTAQYSAEFGRSAGAVINVATKSGTNQFHGFAYDYLQNDALNARNYFDVTKVPLRSNRFGGGLGGPVIRNKIFFFGNYEGLRSPFSSQLIGIVPTALEKTGDFSQSGYTIYDPTSTHPDPNDPTRLIRNPFPQNKIPSSMMNNVAQYLMGFYPDPNYSASGITANYLTDLKNNESLNIYNAKADAYLTSKDTLSFRYTLQRRNELAGGWMPNGLIDGLLVLNGSNMGATYAHTFNSQLLNEFRFGYNTTAFDQSAADSKNYLSQFNIPGLVQRPPFTNGFPWVVPNNVLDSFMVRPIPFIPNPWLMNEHTYQVLDSVSYQKGTHTLKFGAEFDRIQNLRDYGYAGNAVYVSSGFYASDAVGDQLPYGTADFLMGLYDAGLTVYAHDPVLLHGNRFDAYVQDYWRATRNLTISLGLRYDIIGAYKEDKNRLINFDFKNGVQILPQSTASIVQSIIDPLPAAFQFRPDGQVLPHTQFHNFAPRVGFAYSLRERIVLRAAYGIFYGVNIANGASNEGTVPPFRIQGGPSGDLNNPLRISDGYAGPTGTLQAPNLSGFYRPLNDSDPYSQKWNTDAQMGITRTTFLDVGYTGAHTIHSYVTSLGNVPLPGPGPIQPRRPFPNVGTVSEWLPIGSNTYNGLEITFRQLNFHGVSGQSAFTYSRSYGLNSGADEGSVTNPFDYSYDYGPTGFDTPFRWVSAVNYKIPVPGNSSGFVNAILGGWETSAVVTRQSGFPFTVGLSTNILNNGTRNRPDMNGNPNWSGSQRTTFTWFDVSKFSIPAQYTYGNEPKNFLRGPALTSVDFALQKAVTIHENYNIALRMEASNFLNHPNFGIPNATFGAPNLGIIQSTVTDGRKIQMSLRFSF